MAAAKQHHPSWGGAREGAGRPPGSFSKGLAEARRLWREKYSEKAIETISNLLDDPDPEIRLAAAKEMMDRLWGKTQQHITIDQDAAIGTVYETMEDMRQSLIDSGLPLDHLEAPRLLKFQPEDSGS